MTGPGASWVMAPFVHCSPLRPGRFSDGSFGLYYAGDRTEVAIAETVHHHARFMRATDEAPGWTSQFRELIGSIDADLDDATGRADLLDPDDYRPSQLFGSERRAAGSNGLTWPSVRFSRRPVHRSLLARRYTDPGPRSAFRVSLERYGSRLREAAG